MRRYGGKSGDDNTDEAMAVNPSSSKGKGGKGGARKPRGVCWNCGETGHYKDKCPKLKVDKAKDDSAKKEKASGSANAAAECKSDLESDGAWVAMDSDDETVPTDDNTSSGDDDWFSEVNEDISGSDNEGLGSCNLLEEFFVATEPPKHKKYSFMQAELYNSGCTKHISPYCENFDNFTEIPPREFLAANKQSFSAIGKGKIVINIPKDTNVSKLRLMEVLYSPESVIHLYPLADLMKRAFQLPFLVESALSMAQRVNKLAKSQKPTGVYINGI